MAQKKKPRPNRSQAKRPQTPRPRTSSARGPIVFGALAFVVVVAIVIAIVVGAGGGGGSGDDSGSLEGFEPAIAFRIRCGGCHGATGEGGVGPKLADHAVADKYPNIADEIAIVTNGRNAMPAFKDRNMSAEQIAAIVKYTREEL